MMISVLVMRTMKPIAVLMQRKSMILMIQNTVLVVHTAINNVYGISNLEKNIVASFNTPHRVASISKVFTALEIMRLHEEGKLNR